MKTMNLYGCARRLSLPVGWLKDNALAGKIPYLKVGKIGMRFDIDAVKKALSDLSCHQLEQPKSDFQEFESSLSFIKKKGLKVSFAGATL